MRSAAARSGHRRAAARAGEAHARTARGSSCEIDASPARPSGAAGFGPSSARASPPPDPLRARDASSPAHCCERDRPRATGWWRAGTAMSRRSFWSLSPGPRVRRRPAARLRMASATRSRSTGQPSRGRETRAERRPNRRPLGKRRHFRNLERRPGRRPRAAVRYRAGLGAPDLNFRTECFVNGIAFRQLQLRCRSCASLASQPQPAARLNGKSLDHR